MNVTVFKSGNFDWEGSFPLDEFLENVNLYKSSLSQKTLDQLKALDPQRAVENFISHSDWAGDLEIDRSELELDVFSTEVSYQGTKEELSYIYDLLFPEEKSSLAEAAATLGVRLPKINNVPLDFRGDPE